MSLHIILYTYSPSVNHPRGDYARTTLMTLLDNLHCSEETKLHIADDGSDPLHIASLVEIAQGYDYEPTITSAERGGYGLSANLAAQVAHDSEFNLHVEDDWQLNKPLLLDQLIAALREKEEFGCVRLGYLGWYYTLIGQFVRLAEQNFIHLLPEYSDDPHLWTGHPRLEKVSWNQKNIGEWPTGLDPNQTEMAISTNCRARGILWPLDLVSTCGDLFEHIGAERAR